MHRHINGPQNLLRFSRLGCAGFLPVQTKRETNMRTWRTYVAATLALSVTALLDGSAQAASPKQTQQKLPTQ